MSMRGCTAGIRAVLLLGLVLAASGCVSPRAYFADRWADAKDVFTASGGIGAGAKARVGPVHVGLIGSIGACGLCSGEFVASIKVMEMNNLIIPASWEGVETAFAVEFMECANARDKGYGAISEIPFITTRKCNPAYYSQIEVEGGLGVTVRLGFNPGELLDFLLGWTSLDIYGDDLAARREREEAEKKAKENEKPKELPAPPAPKQPGATP
jgi:hypothetical protein